ncbi:hypothetical protein FGO68_gene7679 [Halteria grandinella]|uniref:Uncharacterized protein n=1 Tax=Halteria grandinella TaxID=5974 RepID=A0A8J8P2T1_HALGN|nr:hypothetical protein FGO68_gene7679 [Halteria grandinella]
MSQAVQNIDFLRAKLRENYTNFVKSRPKLELKRKKPNYKDLEQSRVVITKPILSKRYNFGLKALMDPVLQTTRPPIFEENIQQSISTPQYNLDFRKSFLFDESTSATQRSKLTQQEQRLPLQQRRNQKILVNLRNIIEMTSPDSPSKLSPPKTPQPVMKAIDLFGNSQKKKKSVIKPEKCSPIKELKTFHDVMETMQSRNCKDNIDSYRSEMRLLNSFANPNTFMTLSHTNLERKISPPRCTTPQNNVQNEKEMFNQYLNLQEYIKMNEKRLYMINRQEFLKQAKNEIDPHKDIRVDFEMYKNQLILNRPQNNHSAFYTTLKANSKLHSSLTQRLTSKQISRCSPVSTLVPLKTSVITLPLQQGGFIDYGKFKKKKAQSPLYDTSTSINHVQSMLSDKRVPFQSTQRELNSLKKKIEDFTIKYNRHQVLQSRFQRKRKVQLFQQ